ncbi:MAG: hypothetical protein AB1611_17090 [bacterium]
MIVLRFTKSLAENYDGAIITDLKDITGASIMYPETDGDDITVVIPGTAPGSPDSISPTEKLSPQQFDVDQDLMD